MSEQHRSRPSVAGGSPESKNPARIIFVAGASFSGSTLMGLMLGSLPGVLFAGELKDYKRRMQSETRGTGHFCSCGGSRETCPFWSEVHARYGLDTELNPSPGFSWKNLVLGIRVLTGVGLGGKRVTPHGSLVETIHDVARERDPDLVYVVDTSKSIHNLDEISRSPGTDVRVIHLVRDGMAVAGSYKKRGFGSLYGMASWAIGNLFVRLYLRRRGLPSITVDYRALCLGDVATYGRINDFLGTNLRPGTAADGIRRTVYHIVSGNGRVRRSASDFQGIRYSDSSWRANPVERFVGRVLVRPMNRSLETEPVAKTPVPDRHASAAAPDGST